MLSIRSLESTPGVLIPMQAVTEVTGMRDLLHDPRRTWYLDHIHEPGIQPGSIGS